MGKGVNPLPNQYDVRAGLSYKLACAWVGRLMMCFSMQSPLIYSALTEALFVESQSGTIYFKGIRQSPPRALAI